MPRKQSPRNQEKSKPSPQQAPIVAISSEDEIIVVLGCAGSGKSTFVQMATSVPQEISNNNSLKAKTTSVNVVRAKASNGEEKGGARLVIIDTPGVENDILSDQPMFVEVGEKTKSSPPIRIAGIIYFIRIEHHTPPTAISAAFSSINQFRGQFPNRFDKMVVFALWKAGNHQGEHKAYSDIQKAVDGERKKSKSMTLITSKGWDMTAESAMAILNEFKNMPGKEGKKEERTRSSIFKRLLALFKSLLSAKQHVSTVLVVVIVGSQTSGKSKFVDGVLSASPSTQQPTAKTKSVMSTQVDGRHTVIINIDLGPKATPKEVIRDFKRSGKKSSPATFILLFQQGSQVDHLEHLGTAFAKIAGDQWREKTKIIDTSTTGNQGKSSAEAAGKTSPEKRQQLTIQFSGTAQEALDILRSLIPRLNV